MHINREFKEYDLQVLKCQLNTEDVNVAGVLERCPHGYPSIIILNPVKEEKKCDQVEKNLNFTAISTPVWLTCPHLNDRIHILESRGFVKKIQHYIKNESELAFSMKMAHVNYAHLRKNIFKQFFRKGIFIEGHSGIFNSGIGGIREIETVKCLHLHVAHFALCEENIAGRITLELLREEKYCKEGKCKYVCDKQRSNSHQKSKERRVS